jgi:isocitrate dehydrogenase kinase/phosphatase
VRSAFMKYHADLLRADFWIRKQQNIHAGIFEDAFPCPGKIRFKR